MPRVVTLRSAQCAGATKKRKHFIRNILYYGEDLVTFETKKTDFATIFSYPSLGLPSVRMSYFSSSFSSLILVQTLGNVPVVKFFQCA